MYDAETQRILELGGEECFTQSELWGKQQAPAFQIYGAILISLY